MGCYISIPQRPETSKDYVSQKKNHWTAKQKGALIKQPLKETWGHLKTFKTSRRTAAKQEDALIQQPLKEIWCHFKTFKTSRGINVFSHGNMLMILSWDDFRRWENIVFNFNKARFPSGIIPNTYCRLYEHNTTGNTTRNTKLCDIDFFKNTDDLFEERSFAEVCKLECFYYRSNLGINPYLGNKPFRPMLVLMDREEFEAWASSASVEEINAADEEIVGRGVEYPARLFRDGNAPTRRNGYLFCEDVGECLPGL